MIRNFLAASAIACMLTVTARAADTTVTLSEVHMCCNSCVTGAANAVKDVAGSKAVGDRAAKTVVVTAPDAATAQKAVNALLAAGYFGKSSDASIKVDATTGAKDGKVQTAEVTGVHLCCGACVTAVKGVLSKVDGVKDNTVAPKAASFTVTGDFAEKAIMDDLQKAGFTGKIK